MLPQTHRRSLAQVSSYNDLQKEFALKQQIFDGKIIDQNIKFRHEVDSRINASKQEFEKLEKRLSQAVTESFTTLD